MICNKQEAFPIKRSTHAFIRGEREKYTNAIYPSTVKLLDSTRLIDIVSILCIPLLWSVTAMLDSQASRSVLSFLQEQNRLCFVNAYIHV